MYILITEDKIDGCYNWCGITKSLEVAKAWGKKKSKDYWRCFEEISEVSSIEELTFL